MNFGLTDRGVDNRVNAEARLGEAVEAGEIDLAEPTAVFAADDPGLPGAAFFGDALEMLEGCGEHLFAAFFTEFGAHRHGHRQSVPTDLDAVAGGGGKQQRRIVVEHRERAGNMGGIAGADGRIKATRKIAEQGVVVPAGKFVTPTLGEKYRQRIGIVDDRNLAHGLKIKSPLRELQSDRRTLAVVSHRDYISTT